MKNNNKVITIDGAPVTEKALEKQAIVLTSLANRVGVLTRLIEGLGNGVKRSQGLSIELFCASGGLNEVTEYLNDLKEDLEKVSNEICPD